MNERIRELIKQAGGIGHDDDSNELTPALVGKGLEKFAELIVRECANVAAEHEALDIYEEIREHFGVEE